MKARILFIVVAFAIFALTACEKTHTTNICTYGVVQNNNGDGLPGIAIITEIEGFAYVDTTYTTETGEFYTRVKNIPYPISKVTVTAEDPKGIYQQMSKNPHYMYECGVGFVPENDCAFAVDEGEGSDIITFILSLK